VDFHGIHWDTFSYLALPRISRAKPAVLSLHDMWALTGHCHASLDCERWRTGCGRCPYPHVAPAVSRDSTWLDWRLKRWVYRRSRLAVVVPSRWLAGVARESILSHFEVHLIPHGINVDDYRPLDRTTCRSMLGLPQDRPVVLFAVEDLANPLKGGDLIVKAVRALPADLKRRIVFLMMGRNGEKMATAIDQPVTCLGYVASDCLKRMVYSAADVFVHPTRADSFGRTVLESLACGTPVASFRVGGIPDMVRNGETGTLAESGDSDGLARGIVELLAPGTIGSFRDRCRAAVMREFTIDQHIERYTKLYRSLIEAAKPAPSHSTAMADATSR
jgi:glycosyltransferase involved in cell wall biosynthesis